MILRQFIAILITIILVNTSFSQDEQRQQQNRNVKTKLYGRVLDKETNKPLESATVQIYSLKDTTKLVKGTATDKDGNFVLEEFRPGKYEVRVSVIGYNTSKIKEVLVSPMDPEVNLGDIKIKSGDEFVTSEIQVEAEQNIMEMGVDKKVFNVEKDINSQSGSVTDVLKNIPSISVDNDGKITLRGSGNVRILLNGKPSGILSSDPNAVLEQIPANTVERVEILNNPTAKYDPEGMAGIINIVLKKGDKSQSSNGYNYNLNVNAGNGDRYNLSTGLSYKLGNVTLFGNYGLRLFHMNMNGDLNRTNFLSDSSHFLNTSSDANMKMQGHIGTFGVDYDINKNNYLGLSVSYSNRDRNRNERTNYQNFNSLSSPTYFYSRNNWEDEKETGFDANLNYKKTFDKKFQVLDASAQFSSSTEKNVTNINQKDLDFNGNPLNTNPTLENDYTNENFYSLSLQADYTHPLKEDLENSYKLKSKFETGFKSIFRQTDDTYNVDNFDYNTNTFIPNLNLNNDFLYKEQIHAVYGTYENNINKFGYQVGLRLEESISNSEQKVTNTKYDRNYFSYFPSLFLKQGISKTVELQLSYTRRINRPRLGFLNPFVDRSDPQNLRIGNPYLKPEYINGIEFGVVKYLPTFSITSSAFYRITEDVITRFTSVDPNGISTSTFANLSKAKSYGVELIGTGSIYKWWYVNASASYFRTDLDGTINSAELNNSGYSWTAKLSSNMTLPNLFDIQLSYYYQGKNVTSQGFGDPVQSLDLAVKKDFLNKRMSLGFRISDIFNTQKWAMTQATNTYQTNFTRKRDSRIAFLTFSYRIGTDDSKKNQRKKKPNVEDNKDNEGQDY